jgi:hypothetical protein
MQHVFQANPVPEARISLQRLGQFIRSRTPIAREDEPAAAQR